MVLAIGNKNLSSWSLRPWLALRHFGITFEEALIPLDRPETAQRIREVSPSGKVPALADGSIHVWDSLAILEYIADKHKDLSLWPKDMRARAVARSVSSEMHSGFAALRTNCPMKVKEFFKGFDSSAAAVDIARIQEIWSMCRSEFGSSGPYLFGEFSIADCMFAPVVFRFRTYDVALNPVCSEYRDTMLKHPGMRDWEEASIHETFDQPRDDKK